MTPWVFQRRLITSSTFNFITHLLILFVCSYLLILLTDHKSQFLKLNDSLTLSSEILTIFEIFISVKLRNFPMSRSILLSLIIGLITLTSCGEGRSVSVVEIDGSSTVFPITAAVAEEFRAVAPNIRVTIGASGTGGGFAKFVQAKIDINDASRAILPSEKKLAKKNDIEYIQLAVAYDGLAVVANPKNDWATYLTVEELEKIWQPSAEGKVEQWSDIRPEWPDKPLTLYGPGTASGTFDYFTKAIVGKTGKSRSDYNASEDDNVLVQGVSTDKYALGFFGLAYYTQNKDELKLLAVDNGKGKPVEPSLKTVSNNTYKPLTRPLFIYVSKKAAQQKAVQRFIKFYLKNVDKYLDQVGYVPLPDSSYQKQLQKFKRFAAKAGGKSKKKAMNSK